MPVPTRTTVPSSLSIRPSPVRLLREELQLLHEPGSYVGEVVKFIKVLLNVQPEDKYIVDIYADIVISTLSPRLRVALRSDSYTLHKILPNKVNPLVSLMMVEKVPDSTYEMVGGLDKQIKEIKEVIELPVKHPELFEALGMAGTRRCSARCTMLELLNQLDGFEPTKNIKVIMATNRIDILDSALLRPGRIDRKIEFPPPGPEARVSILRIHSRKMSLQRGINLRALAEKMGQCSGAEVRGICTEAGMYALRERRQHVTQEDFEFAVAKVLKKNQEGNTSVNKLFS
ncbi:26S proteasome regulatory subunit 8 [Pleurotus pulmonarius]